LGEEGFLEDGLGLQFFFEFLLEEGVGFAGFCGVVGFFGAAVEGFGLVLEIDFGAQAVFYGVLGGSDFALEGFGACGFFGVGAVGG